MATFCQQQQHTVCEWLALEPQTTEFPSDSTFRRVFLLVDAPVWVHAFNVWARLQAPAFAGQLWSVDGKSIKGTSVGGNSSAQDFATLVSVSGQPVGVVPLELMSNAQVSEIEVAKPNGR